ncbi:MAG: RsmD family RNA methyltransferase, partial [Nitrospirae bacterium]|nr:RsmD family RNA methyltransferase [Nitrospirota bacterium]
PSHLRILRENLTVCGFGDRARVIQGDALALLRKKAFPPCDFVFLDPPYDLPKPEELLISVGKNVIVNNFVVYEHPRRREIPGELEGLIRTRTADYGEIRLSFFEIRNPE